MAKRKKALPALKRNRPRDDESLLLRSAESLGRIIGALQRQLDSATKRLSDSGGDPYNETTPRHADRSPRPRRRTSGHRAASRQAARPGPSRTRGSRKAPGPKGAAAKK
jgi:hypothetical protein